jgi:hypothetical protein
MLGSEIDPTGIGTSAERYGESEALDIAITGCGHRRPPAYRSLCRFTEPHAGKVS